MKWTLPILLLLVPALAGRTVDAPPRPSIVLVMADDQGWGDTGYNGHPELKTPNLDALAASGLRLDRFYAAHCNCSPTRGSVLTGRHPNRYGTFHPGAPIRAQELTVARVLRSAGYATGHFGKWHLNGRNGDPNTTAVPGRAILADDPLSPGKLGFDEWVSADNFFDLDPVLGRNGVPEKFHGDSSDVTTDEALKFIRKQAAAGRPFLSVVWFGSPHVPHLALPADKAPYSGLPEKEQNDLGEIAAVDRNVGRLRAALRELKVAEHTLLWYCSDNGGHQGPKSTGNLRGQKGSLWDGGLRVPGFIEWPARIPKPFISAVPTSTLDLYPTVLEAAGAAAPNQIQPLDGVSLLPLFDMKFMNSPDRSDATLKRLEQGLAPLSVLLLVLLGYAAGPATALAAEAKRMVPTDRPVRYEAFGAVGDGVADDLPAIVEAHAFANAHGLSVVARPGATYHLGRRALTAIIATDTDWGTARFNIDDTEVENHRTSLFDVRSLLEPVTLSIPRLTRDQRRLDVRPPRDCWVRVENSRQRRYIRRGLNQNNGSTQRDCFILRRDGTIEGAIDWDYDTITRVEGHPLDDRPLILRGGVFTTTANRMKQAKGYNYWARNIAIHRSNTSVVGLTHHIVGEGDFGHPYGGFLAVGSCANVTLRDCFVTGHKTYSTIGTAGKPVSMGTYDLSANEVVNFTMIGCRMDNICDTTRWGVIGANFCKNILLENCTLSRMDTHQGVSGTYTIRGCTLGHAGLNAIGRGTLTVENSTLNGRSLVSLRGDYGSTWEGTIVIRNSRWIPACGVPIQPYLLNASNDGQHDFGYPCFMPREILIDGLVIDDQRHPNDYAGPYLFTDPDGGAPSAAARPFPYRLTERVTLRNLTTASGRKPRLSPDPALAASVRVTELK